MISRRSFLKNVMYAGFALHCGNIPLIERNLSNLNEFIDGKGLKEKLYFINTSGDVIFEPKFSLRSYRFREGYVPVMINDTTGGFYNKNGEIMLQSFCSGIGEFSHGLAYMENWRGLKNDSTRNSETGYINQSGELQIARSHFQKNGDNVKFMPSCSATFAEGLAPICINGKHGFINTNGDVVILPQFIVAESFTEGLAVVYINGQAGCINRNGEIVIEPRFRNIYGFEKGCALAEMQNRQLCFIDKAGTIIYKLNMNWDEYIERGIPEYCILTKTRRKHKVSHKWVGRGFSEGLIKISCNDKYGFANEQDDVIIPPIYDAVCNFSNGLAAVGVHRKFGFINKEGLMVIKPHFNMVFGFSEGLTFATTY